MAHQSLYRTYRPQRFDDVVGQSHITRTLRNAVADQAVAHAYLFTGPRGTGKTTTARILAKALLCEKGPTPDFDDTCNDCVEITEGRHPDVHELDAASRTGVEAIRDEVITKVGYAATRGGYKVYIIDEVHMLSTSAFNALLKTLEEPPPKTVFVLCTTHPQKVPETIHSRCQRFDFRRIGIEDIVERLEQIALAEKIEVAPGSLTLIAKHAAGGMRDAISTLDQLAAFTGRNISIDDVEGLLGEVDSALLFEVTEAIERRDIAECFRMVARLAEAGVDVPEFVKSLIGHFRDMFVVVTVGDTAGIVDDTDDNLARLEAQAGTLGRERIARLLDVLGQLSSDLRWAGDQRLALEVALVRMARPQGDLTLEALEERIAALESGAVMAASDAAPRPPAAAAPVATPSAASAASPQPRAAAKPAKAETPSAAEKASADVTVANADTASVEQPEAVPAVDPGLGEALARRIAAHQSGEPAAGPGVDEPEPQSEAAYPAERHASARAEDVPTVAPGTAQALREAAAAALKGAKPAPAADEETSTYVKGSPQSLDRAKVKRAWPAIVAELKKRKSGAAHLFAPAIADVDGEELVVEFPGSEAFTMDIAKQPENMQLLQQAIAAVLGFKPPLRYQLGRGVVRPAEAPPRNVIHHMPDSDVPPPAEPDVVDVLAGEFGDIEVEHLHDHDPEGSEQ